MCEECRDTAEYAKRHGDQVRVDEVVRAARAGKNVEAQYVGPITQQCGLCGGVTDHIQRDGTLICPCEIPLKERVSATIPIESDPINHPHHYNSHTSGVECITITEHFNFCLGNVIKYIWRAGEKDNDALEDLKKAQWYLTREILRREELVRKTYRAGKTVKEIDPTPNRKAHLPHPSLEDHQCKLSLNICRGACVCLCPNCELGKRLWAEAGYP